MSPRATYDWSGFYGGVHAGYGGGMTDWGGINNLAKGSLVGGQIGFNRQIGNAVIGVEADAAWSGMKGSRFEEVTVPFSVSLFQATVASKVEHIETTRKRRTHQPERRSGDQPDHGSSMHARTYFLPRVLDPSARSLPRPPTKDGDATS
jgi:hypothetical protein